MAGCCCYLELEGCATQIPSNVVHLRGRIKNIHEWLLRVAATWELNEDGWRSGFGKGLAQARKLEFHEAQGDKLLACLPIQHLRMSGIQ